MHPTRSFSATATTTRSTRTTRWLLGCGILAGPGYVTASVAQALTRDGFDLSRHAWSLLANGELGWIQVTNFVLTGLLVLAGAAGLRRAMPAGRGRTWAPALIASYGVSLVGAGTFRADPAEGFPAGTPEAATVSWHGALHLLIGGIGFLCLVAACAVLARHFARHGRPALAWASRITGVAFLAGFAGIATGSHGPVTLAFAAAVVLAWAWLTRVIIHFYRTTA